MKTNFILYMEVAQIALRCMTHDIIHNVVPRVATWLGKTSEIETSLVKDPASLRHEHWTGLGPVTQG